MSAPHTLLLASAGTGKTFRLATHFAALLTLGVPPERILATTFTRKAAGEILDRVLGRLVDAARDDAKGAASRASIAAAAQRVCGRPVAISREAALARLAGLARRIGRFQVRTLDSFFVHVARLFAYELALAPEWHMADGVEDEELRDEVLAGVIAELGHDERVGLLRDVTRSGAPNAAHSALASAIEGALQPHRDAVPGAWDRLVPDAPPAEDELRAAQHLLATFELPRKKSGPKGQPRPPYQRWALFQARARDVIERRDWKAWLGLTLPAKVRAGETLYDRVVIAEDVAAAVRTVDRAALADLTAELASANRATGRLCDLYVARERAVKDRAGAYRFEDFPRALAEGPAGAGDPESLALWRADLAYRLDSRFAHLLLDEFQDTAPLQWRLLLPLAEELLAGGDDDGVPRSFFCVGDVKQSIYGWRAAEPRILGEMEARHPVLTAEPMTESWRSSEVVLETMNRIFEGLAGRAAFAGDEREALRVSAEEWVRGFARHRRAPGAGPCAGAAILWEASPADGEGAKDAKSRAAMGLAALRVQELVRRVPEATVAVLLRRRRWISPLLYRLRKLGIDASGEGGNPLTDSPLVSRALALLHLADHPGDGVAALAVVDSPFAPLYGLEGLAPEHLCAKERWPEASGLGERTSSPRDATAPAHGTRDPSARVPSEGLPSEGVASDGPSHERVTADPVLEHRRARAAIVTAARRVRRELAEEGYGAYFERLAHAVCPTASAWDRARFEQLVELALTYDARAGLRPTAFAALVRRQPVESPSGARVRVMTVHASKGLEFDAVVLPELGESFQNRVPKYLAARSGPLEPTELLTHRPVDAVSSQRADLAALDAAERARGLVDELSVLYVAATRAIHQLELIVPCGAAKRPSVPPCSAASLVLEALTGDVWHGAAATDDAASPTTADPPRARELWRHEGSDFAWRPGEASAAVGREAEVEPTAPSAAASIASLAAAELRLAPAPAPRLAPHRTPTGAEDESCDVAALLAPRERGARELGTLVHELLAGVEWLEDEHRDDAALEAALRRHGAAPAEVAAAIRSFRRALQHPVVRAALARTSTGPLEADEAAAVLRERSFDVELAAEDPAGTAAETWRGAVDRLVVVRRAGAPVRALVLDFKTDAVEDTGVAARAEHYRPQLAAYRRAAAALLGLDPDHVRAALLFLAPGVRVDL